MPGPAKGPQRQSETWNSSSMTAATGVCLGRRGLKARPPPVLPVPPQRRPVPPPLPPPTGLAPLGTPGLGWMAPPQGSKSLPGGSLGPDCLACTRTKAGVGAGTGRVARGSLVGIRLGHPDKSMSSTTASQAGDAIAPSRRGWRVLVEGGTAASQVRKGGWVGVVGSPFFFHVPLGTAGGVLAGCTGRSLLLSAL